MAFNLDSNLEEGIYQLGQLQLDNSDPCSDIASSLVQTEEEEECTCMIRIEFSDECTLHTAAGCPNAPIGLQGESPIATKQNVVNWFEFIVLKNITGVLCDYTVKGVDDIKVDGYFEHLNTLELQLIERDISGYQAWFCDCHVNNISLGRYYVAFRTQTGNSEWIQKRLGPF